MEMIQKRMDARGQGGFTLIELLVVIAILAILAGVVVFAVGNSTNNANQAACETEAASIKTAVAAADTANEVNAVAETWNDYVDGDFTYFTPPAAPAAGDVVADFTGTGGNTAASAAADPACSGF